MMVLDLAEIVCQGQRRRKQKRRDPSNFLHQHRSWFNDLEDAIQEGQAVRPHPMWKISNEHEDADQAQIGNHASNYQTDGQIIGE